MLPHRSGRNDMLNTPFAWLYDGPLASAGG
jgi:hypothetical protein